MPDATPPPAADAAAATTPPAASAAASTTPPGTDSTPPAQTPAPAAATAPADVALTFPEGFKPDEQSITWLKETAKEAGIKPEFLQKFVDFDLKRMTAAKEAEKQAFDSYVKSNEEAVKKEWGVDFAKNNDLAQKALAKFDPEKKLTGLFAELGLGTHPLIMNHLKQLGAALAEDNANRGGKPTAPVDNSPEAAMKQVFTHPSSAQMFQRR